MNVIDDKVPDKKIIRNLADSLNRKTNTQGAAVQKTNTNKVIDKKTAGSKSSFQKPK